MPAVLAERYPEQVVIQLDPKDLDTAQKFSVSDDQAACLVQLLKQHNSMAVVDVTIPRVRWYHQALHPHSMEDGWITIDQWEDYEEKPK